MITFNNFTTTQIENLSAEQKSFIDNFNIGFLSDDQGNDWYQSMGKFSDDTMKIAYDKNGVIRIFSRKAHELYPLGMSVAEVNVDEIPPGMDISGMWFFDPATMTVSQDRQIKARSLRDGFIRATDRMTIIDYTIQDVYLTEAQRQELFDTRLNYKKWPTATGWPELALPDVPDWIMSEITAHGYVAPVWP